MTNEPTRNDFLTGDFISENTVRGVLGGGGGALAPTTKPNRRTTCQRRHDCQWKDVAAAGWATSSAPLVGRRADRSRRGRTPRADGMSR